MKLKMVILGLVMSVAVLSAAEVNIMTFNIRMGTANDGSDKWSLRKELVFEVIRNHDPDVIGLQEAFKFQIVLCLNCILICYLTSTQLLEFCQ